MTLLELSVSYQDSEDLIRGRMKELRNMIKTEPDTEKARALRYRITELAPLLREMRELAQLTAHYYDRGYFRNVHYTL